MNQPRNVSPGYRVNARVSAYLQKMEEHDNSNATIQVIALRVAINLMLAIGIAVEVYVKNHNPYTD